MHIAPRVSALAVFGIALAACDGGGTADRDDTALASRLNAIEQRLTAAEAGVEPIERLRNDVASLDRRMSSLEASVREMTARSGGGTGAAATPTTRSPSPTAPAPTLPPRRPSAAGPGAWNNPTTREQRAERRAELRALSDEFRSRLAEVRSDRENAGNQEQTREILDWYREQRRMILSGEGRSD
jgi:hypothetical protein